MNSNKLFIGIFCLVILILGINIFALSRSNEATRQEIEALKNLRSEQPTLGTAPSPTPEQIARREEYYARIRENMKDCKFVIRTYTGPGADGLTQFIRTTEKPTATTKTWMGDSVNFSCSGGDAIYNTKDYIEAMR